MSIALLFRRSAKPNLFRKVLLSSILIPDAKEIVICSGFFQQSFNGSAYKVSKGGLASRLKKSGASVVTIGVHNRTWSPAFDAFNADLKKRGIPVTPIKVTGLRWHAKVFMVSTARGPVLAIIGSSNMTRNAFDTSKPFNYEADTVLWVAQARGVSAIVDAALEGAPSSGVVRARYSRTLNADLTVRQRLQALRDQLPSVAKKPRTDRSSAN